MYRIKDWHSTFENNRSRELKRLDWVPVPNTMDTGGYIELVEEHPNGAAHFGAWMAIVEIASRQKTRGMLPQLPAGIPHSDAAIARLLSRISRIPAIVFMELLPRLLDPNIGWIEQADQIQHDASIKEEKPSARTATIPHEGAGIPHDDATIPHEGAALRERAGARLITRKEGKKERTTNTHTLEKSRSIVAQNGNCAPVRWPYLADETYAAFVVAACGFWEDLIEEDLQKSWQFTWKKFTFAEKLSAVEKLNTRIASGENAQYVTRPPKYLEDGDWKRPPRKAESKNGNGNGRSNGTEPYRKPANLIDKAEYERLKAERERRIAQ